jgi:hypothetical protein
LPLGNTCTEGQIDGIARAAEDGAMSEVTAASPRRSSRVFHKMRVQAQGRAHDRKKFKETCETVVVNAHGGLLLLKHEVANGEMLVITNPETQEELECRIVYLGDLGDKGQRVGVEFLTPAPRFWGVEFVDSAPSEDASAVH